MSLDASAAVARIGGVLTHVSGVELDPPGVALFLRVAHVGRGLHPDEALITLDGAGISTSAADAEFRAVMDGLKNYAASAWRAADFRWASAEDLGDDAVPIAEIARVQPLDERDRIRWIEGWDLADGRAVWVPAVMTYVALPPAVEAESFWPQISTGCAAHADLGAAVTAGLLECVERDALALAWILQRGLPRITNVDEALAPLTGCGLDVTVLDATTDVGIPVVFALVRGDGPVATVLAASCKTDPVEAAARAVAEAVRARTLLALAPEAPDDPAAFRAATDASRFLGRPGNDEPWAFLAGGATVDLDELERVNTSKPALMARLDGAGLRAYAVDLTVDELADVGAAAVRVIVPGFQPLSVMPGRSFENHQRLDRAALHLGLDPAARNSHPVPFA